MSQRFVSLTCRHCGGKLDVYDDMERFACGFCGVEMMAERRGGTISLNVVTDAIEKVQTGTDRIAVELTIQRLDAELKAAHRASTVIGNAMNRLWNWIIGCSLFALIGVVNFQSDSGNSTVLLSVVAIFVLYVNASGKRSFLKRLQERIDSIQKELQQQRDTVRT